MSGEELKCVSVEDCDDIAIRNSCSFAEKVRVSNSSSPSLHEGLVETNSATSKPTVTAGEKEDGGFILVRTRKQRRTAQLPAGVHRITKVDTRKTHGLLRGAKAFRTKTYFLSGIDEDCSAEQIRKHCRERGVNTSGCYLLRSRNWGTTSAKLFVAVDCCSVIEGSGFWLEFIECRLWMRDPPARLHTSPGQNQN